MNPRSLIRVTTLLAALGATAVGTPSGGAAAEQSLRLTIAFTGDVSGYLEPCG